MNFEAKQRPVTRIGLELLATGGNTAHDEFTGSNIRLNRESAESCDFERVSPSSRHTGCAIASGLQRPACRAHRGRPDIARPANREYDRRARARSSAPAACGLRRGCRPSLPCRSRAARGRSSAAPSSASWASSSAPTRHTPRFCGHLSSTGDLLNFRLARRRRRTSWLTVGIRGWLSLPRGPGRGKLESLNLSDCRPPSRAGIAMDIAVLCSLLAPFAVSRRGVENEADAGISSPTASSTEARTPP